MIYPPFLKEVIKSIKSQEKNKLLNEIAQRFKLESAKSNYSYNFTWLGRPIIQYPQDMVAIQEVIYKVKPDLIIETGIAHGGSLILSASMLALLDMEEANDCIPLVPLLPNSEEAKLSAASVSIVRADKSIDLLILTMEPPSPVALVKMLTVLSSVPVPPNFTSVPPVAVVKFANKLTPLKVVSLI